MEDFCADFPAHCCQGIQASRYRFGAIRWRKNREEPCSIHIPPSVGKARGKAHLPLESSSKRQQQLHCAPQEQIGAGTAQQTPPGPDPSSSYWAESRYKGLGALPAHQAAFWEGAIILYRDTRLSKKYKQPEPSWECCSSSAAKQLLSHLSP